MFGIYVMLIPPRCNSFSLFEGYQIHVYDKYVIGLTREIHGKSLIVCIYVYIFFLSLLVKPTLQECIHCTHITMLSHYIPITSPYLSWLNSSRWPRLLPGRAQGRDGTHHPGPGRGLRAGGSGLDAAAESDAGWRAGLGDGFPLSWYLHPMISLVIVGISHLMETDIIILYPKTWRYLPHGDIFTNKI